MKTDPLREFVALRQALVKEKSELELRLEQINRALVHDGTITTITTHAPRKSRGRKSVRVKNTLPLKEAVIQVTKDKALAKPEILTAVGKLGYRFRASNPINSLNTVLYTGRAFKNKGGKFSPV